MSTKWYVNIERVSDGSIMALDFETQDEAVIAYMGYLKEKDYRVKSLSYTSFESKTFSEESVDRLYEELLKYNSSRTQYLLECFEENKELRLKESFDLVDSLYENTKKGYSVVGMFLTLIRVLIYIVVVGVGLYVMFSGIEWAVGYCVGVLEMRFWSVILMLCGVFFLIAVIIGAVGKFLHRKDNGSER